VEGIRNVLCTKGDKLTSRRTFVLGLGFYMVQRNVVVEGRLLAAAFVRVILLRARAPRRVDGLEVGGKRYRHSRCQLGAARARVPANYYVLCDVLATTRGWRLSSGPYMRSCRNRLRC
jgi:hypothetical protein